MTRLTNELGGPLIGGLGAAVAVLAWALQVFGGVASGLAQGLVPFRRVASHDLAGVKVLFVAGILMALIGLAWSLLPEPREPAGRS